MFGLTLLFGCAVSQETPHTTQRVCDRLIAIGDLHGDYDHAKQILVGAGLVSDETVPKWIADETTCLVQSGDLVDRGEFSKQLYDMFERFRTQANGRVVNLMGNHELMNLMGDLRYVDARENTHWGGEAARAAHWSGDWGAKLIKEFLVAELQNGILFVHAGLRPEFAEKGNMTKLQETVRNGLLYMQANGGTVPYEFRRHLRDEGPFWTRVFMEDETRSCKLLRKTLRLFNATRMVVGHTQVMGGISSRCGGRLLAIDTIISRNGYPMCWGEEAPRHGCIGVASFLEIKDGEAYAVVVNPTGAADIISKTPLPLGDISTSASAEL
eukprot:GEMP01052234.1.p1 GENE.GEMP01052234.1~~GEMP01052234.1.p1  ORF type:complete len:326 (+),score=50.69 GEMP01052234.1:139-1116(+)